MSWRSPKGAPNRRRERGAVEGLVEGAAGEAERGGADGGAEHVQRRHGDLEALARSADALRQGHAAALEAQGGEGMRRDHLDALGDRQARRVRLDQEGREPAGAGRLAGAGEDDVEVGDAAVRDPGLHPVEPDVAGAVGDGGGGERGDVGAGLGLGEREGGDGLARGDGRQDAALQLVRAEQADRAGAEALHGEGEVGEAVAVGQGLAGEAEGADVEGRVQPAMGGGHGRPEPSGLAQRRDEAAAGGVHVAVVDEGRDGLGRPGAQVVGEAAMWSSKKGQCEEGGVRHERLRASPSPSAGEGVCGVGVRRPWCRRRRIRRRRRAPRPAHRRQLLLSPARPPPPRPSPQRGEGRRRRSATHP